VFIKKSFFFHIFWKMPEIKEKQMCIDLAPRDLHMQSLTIRPFVVFVDPKKSHLIKINFHIFRENIKN